MNVVGNAYDVTMHEVRFATESPITPRGTAASNNADEAATRQKARELMRQGAERRKAATATITRRQTTSTPLDTPTASPPSPQELPAEAQTPKATATTTSTSKADGDGTAAPAKDKPHGKGTGYRGYGKPFEKGNRMQQRARNRLTDAEIRDEVRCAMSKVSLRQIVRRQIKIATTGSNRDASTAARLLMTLVGTDEVMKGNASEHGTMITMPSPPER